LLLLLLLLLLRFFTRLNGFYRDELCVLADEKSKQQRQQ
jgi:hypothetical protein